MSTELNATPDFESDGASNYTPPTYDIDPADQHIADSIRSMDVLSQVPGPTSAIGAVKVPEPTLSALPPAMREQVEAQLAMVPASKRAESEKELVVKALRKHSLHLRSLAGVAGTATPYHREQAVIARDIRTAEAEFDALSTQLHDIIRYDNQWDEATQSNIPVPVFAVEGDRRKAYMQQQDQILYRISLLVNGDGSLGIEGQRRMAKALHDSVQLQKAVAEQKADNEEVEKRAQELAREARINKRAGVRAKMLDPDFHS